MSPRNWLKSVADNEQWLEWLAAVTIISVTATFALISYAHSTFITRDEITVRADFSKNQIDELRERLTRIESKIDTLGANSQK